MYNHIQSEIEKIRTQNPQKNFLDLTADDKIDEFIDNYIANDNDLKNMKYTNIYDENEDDNERWKVRSLIRSKLQYNNTGHEFKNMTLSQYANEIDKYMGEFKNIIYAIIFQIIYTLNVFTEIDFKHDDLHISNILLQYSNVESDYYYVVKDKIVNIKSNILPLIYDFDRSDPNDSRYSWSNKVDIKSKYDLKFFLHYIKNEYSENIFLIKSINKILYKNSKYKARKYDILFGTPITNWSGVNDEQSILESFNMMMTPYQALEWLRSNDPESILTNNSLVKYYNNLSQLQLTSNSKIFFPPKTDIIKLRDELYKNDSWNQLSDIEKTIVCHPLVNTEAKVGGGNYIHKYIKYKTKYMKYKQK